MKLTDFSLTELQDEIERRNKAAWMKRMAISQRLRQDSSDRVVLWTTHVEECSQCRKTPQDLCREGDEIVKGTAEKGEAV